MSFDFLRDLKGIGRDLSITTPMKVTNSGIPDRVALIISNPHNLLDQSAYNDAYVAADMLSRADFRVYFIVSPKYAEFCEWMIYFLSNVPEHLIVVFTGFRMVAPDGTQKDGHPFVIKDREVTPKRVLSLVRKHKNEKSRLTFLISGCPAVETWSNRGDNNQCLSFSLTSTRTVDPSAQSFGGSMPPRVILITAAPRLDSPRISDRTKANSSFLFKSIYDLVNSDPTISAFQMISPLAASMREKGEELAVYSSSDDVVNDTPLLL